MPLTEMAVRNAKPKEKTYRLTDGGGMYFEVSPQGGRYWRLNYRFDGKQKTLALGTYPQVGLADARAKCFEARKKIAAGVDPSAEKQALKREAILNARNTFFAVAEEWFQLNSLKWTPEHAKRIWRRYEMHIFPYLGKKGVKTIRPPEVLEVIRRVEAAGTTDMSHCVFQSCSVVFRHAIATGRAEFNPAASLQGSLKAHVVEHFPSITAKELPGLFKAMRENKEVSDLTKKAIHLLMLTFVRQGELRQALWEDIHWEDKEWRVRPETTKKRTLHIVPLASQTLALLKDLQGITGNDRSGLLFPNQQRRKHPMMSENTINHALRALGYEGRLVGHGFRSLASTTLNELGFNGDWVERQLAHMERDSTRAAYNYAQHLPERRKMMQEWADYLERASHGAHVLKMKGVG